LSVRKGANATWVRDADPLRRSGPSPIVITFVVFLLALVMINVAEVFFITKTLLSSALTYGLVGASFGAGNIAGAVAASRLKQDDVALARASLASLIVVSVLVGLIGLVEHVGYLYPILVVMGIAVGVVNVASTTLYDRSHARGPKRTDVLGE